MRGTVSAKDEVIKNEMRRNNASSRLGISNRNTIKIEIEFYTIYRSLFAHRDPNSAVLLRDLWHRVTHITRIYFSFTCWVKFNTVDSAQVPQKIYLEKNGKRGAAVG